MKVYMLSPGPWIREVPRACQLSEAIAMIVRITCLKQVPAPPHYFGEDQAPTVNGGSKESRCSH